MYTPFGQCNTDQELDLVNEFIIASNAVNDQVNGATTSNLDEVFLVECDNVNTTFYTAIAVDYQPYAVAYKYYNVGLNNVNKIQLHGSSFQNALSNTQDAGGDICHITLGTDTLLGEAITGSSSEINFDPNDPNVVVPIGFADEFGGGNYDPNGNWSNTPGTYYYTAPLPGVYSFTTNLELEIQNLKSCNGLTLSQNGVPLFSNSLSGYYGVVITISIKAYSDITFATLINSSSLTFQLTANGTFNYPVTSSVNLPLGGAVRVQTSAYLARYLPAVFGSSPVPYGQGYSITSGSLCNFSYSSTEPKINVYALEDSTFVCNGTPDAALILAPFDGQAYKSRLHEFEYNISSSDFRTIQLLPIGMVSLIKDEAERLCWIEQLSYNNWTGRANIKLISQDATI